MIRLKTSICIKRQIITGDYDKDRIQNIKVDGEPLIIPENKMPEMFSSEEEKQNYFKERSQALTEYENLEKLLLNELHILQSSRHK